MKSELINRYDDYSDINCPSDTSIWRILKKMGYKLTKVQRVLVQNKIDETDDIFNNVHEAMNFALASDATVAAISVDDKAKKNIGKLGNNGKGWLERKALDHDTKFEYSVTPFGILDLKTDEPFVYGTLTKSTAEFKVDCIENYLKKKLINTPIKTLIIFLDNGPENSGRRRLWLKKMCELATKYNIKIELVYYPPYHSKYNKIERYWARLSYEWNKIVIDNLFKLVVLTNKVLWKGKKTNAVISLKEYEQNKIVTDEEMAKLENTQIYRDEKLQKWSIVITP